MAHARDVQVFMCSRLVGLRGMTLLSPGPRSMSISPGPRGRTARAADLGAAPKRGARAIVPRVLAIAARGATLLRSL